MTKKSFLLPWQKTYTITCPKCGGTINTRPLWFWQKQPDQLAKLQLQLCHSLDSELLEKIPMLTENDWKSKQKCDAFLKELTDDSGNMKPLEEIERLLKVENGPSEMFMKHGIFALVSFFTETELKALFLFLGLMPKQHVKQLFFMGGMQISRSHACTIMKKFVKWRLVQRWKGSGRGRARGRQLTYALSDEAQRILEQNLNDHDFFRGAVGQTLKPIAEISPNIHWRKDLLETP